MLLFDFLADRYGRRKMYGIELIVLVVGTMGVIMSSTGFSFFVADGSINGSMGFVSWLSFFRFLSGCGLGGDCPLSVVIASE